jgi:SAM-dependent methyltransferase
MDASEIYDKEFFEMHLPWRCDYIGIADLLCEILEFDSALDLGCGNGFILARLMERGKRVRGVEGSVHAFEAMPDDIKKIVLLHDLTIPISVSKFDLVMCTEVAEHLPNECADVLVETICGNAEKNIYFTAATPGQGGHHHVNEQPHAYWAQKFRLRGYDLNELLTAECRLQLARRIRNATWLAHNSMIYIAH